MKTARGSDILWHHINSTRYNNKCCRPSNTACR